MLRQSYFCTSSLQKHLKTFVCTVATVGCVFSPTTFASEFLSQPDILLMAHTGPVSELKLKTVISPKPIAGKSTVEKPAAKNQNGLASILVASRKMANGSRVVLPAEKSGLKLLEPISQYSEYSPSLAAPQPFGAEVFVPYLAQKTSPVTDTTLASIVAKKKIISTALTTGLTTDTPKVADREPTIAAPALAALDTTAEAGPIEIGPTEIGPTEIGPIETGPTEIGPIETGPIEIGPIEIGPIETGPIEIGPIETDPTETTMPAETAAINLPAQNLPHASHEPLSPQMVPLEITTAEKDAATQFAAGLSKNNTLPVEITLDKNSPLVSAAMTTDRSLTPALFHGIGPGTNRDEVVSKWGTPLSTRDIEHGEILTYANPLTKAIHLKLTDDKVTVIKVELAKPIVLSTLVEKFGLDQFRDAVIKSPAGTPLAMIYPEKGVTLLFENELEKTSPITEIRDTPIMSVVIQKPNSASFSARAQQQLHGPYEQNIEDLKTAIKLDRKNSEAYHLLSKIELQVGHLESAITHIERAIEIDPEMDAYMLTLTKCLEQQGKFDEAVRMTRTIIDNKTTSDLDRAVAYYQLGLLASQGPTEIASKSINFHTLAIELADPLTKSSVARDRVTAQELLVDAHLAVARNISHQHYDQKRDVVPQWIGRASSLAEGLISENKATVELRLRIAEEALGALANFKPTLDPTPWVKEAEESAKALLLLYPEDSLWQARINRQLGNAYFQALQVEHTRAQRKAAIKYSNKAIESLKALEASENRNDTQLLSELYFHTGAVHAILNKDHSAAVKWYDKSENSSQDGIVSDYAMTNRRGEAMVSMGVSYWQTGQKKKALRLTTSGAEMIKAGIKAGILEQHALAVPYSNLSTMYRSLGNKQQAAKYNSLAKRFRNARKGSQVITQREKRARQTGQKSISNAPPQRGPAVSRSKVSSRMHGRGKR